MITNTKNWGSKKQPKEQESARKVWKRFFSNDQVIPRAAKLFKQPKRRYVVASAHRIWSKRRSLGLAVETTLFTEYEAKLSRKILSKRFGIKATIYRLVEVRGKRERKR